VAALLLGELVPTAISCGGERCWLPARPGRQAWARPPSARLLLPEDQPAAPQACAMRGAWGAAEGSPPFASLRSRSPQGEGWRGYPTGPCLVCSARTDSSLAAAGEPRYLRFSSLSSTRVWLPLCHATWSYSLVPALFREYLSSAPFFAADPYLCLISFQLFLLRALL